MKVFDERRCLLGESAFWHPALEQLFWVDILNNKVLWRGSRGTGEAKFEHPVSALACAGETTLMAADDSRLFVWDALTGIDKTLCPLETHIASNRSNDGRADPWGGFWVGTMEREGRNPSGSIYRWYGNELRALVSDLTIPNGICFDRERSRAYFSDTPGHKIFRVQCDDEGWPASEPEVHCDFSEEGIFVDGSVTDLAGNIRAACWDLGAVITISPEGQLLQRKSVPTPRPTCVAFGGPSSNTIYISTASVDLEGDENAGVVYMIADEIGGHPEPTVALG